VKFKAVAQAVLFVVVWAALNLMANLAFPGREPGPPGWYLLPSVDVTVLLLIFALLGWRGRRLPQPAIWALAVVLIAIRIFRTSEGLIQLNYYRPVNLYLDLPLLPELVRLLYSTVRLPALLLGGAAVVLGLALVLGLAVAAIGYAQRSLAHRPLHRGIVVAVVLICAALTPLWPSFDVRHLGLFGQSIAPRIAEQIHFAVNAQDLRRRKSTAIARTQDDLRATAADLKQLRRADVFIFFVESYGSTVLRKPDFVQRIQPSYDAFAAALGDHQFTIRSGQLDSSTYGGGSWLAHATFAAGVSIKDGLEFAVLRQTEPAPRTLAGFFAQAGYRTVLVQPGTTRTWPEGEISGFQHKYYAPSFDYAGPPFGWATMPDQYVIDFLHRREVAGARQPLFIEYALISSHAPWSVHAPIIDDWSRIGDGRVFRDARPLVFPITWQNLGEAGEAYVASLSYDLRVLQQYIVNNADRPALYVVLGDHQPPGNLTDDDPSPAVPVHIIGRDAALVDSFAADGYAPGMLPPATGAVAGMETFLTTFLARLSSR
jgi:hypothetical protein